MASDDVPRSRAKLDRSRQEKLLIFCPQITDDSLLHFSQVGDSYRLRAFAGRLKDQRRWFRQADALTATEFLRKYAPKERIDVKDERINLEERARWTEIVTTQNRRLGIGS